MDYLLKQQLLNALGRLTIDNVFHGILVTAVSAPELSAPPALHGARTLPVILNILLRHAVCGMHAIPTPSTAVPLLAVPPPPLTAWAHAAYSAQLHPEPGLSHGPNTFPSMPPMRRAHMRCAPLRASHTRAPRQAGSGLFLHYNQFFEMLPMRRARACCPPPFRRPCARCPTPAAYCARAPSRAYLWAGSLGFTPGAVHAPAAVAPRPAPTVPCVPTRVPLSPPNHRDLHTVAPFAHLPYLLTLQST
ncbi:hypothetical protein B0H14DRAFT_3522880 [Mycena olivaceomarginata]|nr:hypothetical protein B0H14DRAFT_3522880 [Mycena olivaceomarginata]